MSTLKDLNDYLFDALNQITNEDLIDAPEDEFERTIKMCGKVTDIADKIIQVNNTVIRAEKFKQDYCLTNNEVSEVIGIEMDKRKN